MRVSLFWKFFFAFWLALLIAGVGVGSAVWWRQRNENALISSVEVHGPARTIVAAAYSTYSHSGFAAFRSVLTEWAQQEDVPLYAVDVNGVELLGRKVDAQIVAQARVMWGSGRYGDVVREIVDEQGQRYLLFVPARNSFHEPMLEPPAPRGSPPPPPDGSQYAEENNGPPPHDVRPPNAAPPARDAGFSVLRDAMHGFDGRDRGPPGPPPHRAPWLQIFFGLIASVLFSALAAWSLSKPIRLLRAGFNDVAAGRFDTRVAEAMGARGDEFGTLGADFDSMATQLHTLIDAQRRLLHDVSHELRSPLARLQAAIGLARQQPEKVSDMLERIERESGRLNDLIGELLTLSRLEGGVPGSMEERIEVDDLIGNLIADAQFEAAPRQIRVELVGQTHATVVGRQELLARAIENVIRNAIRFSSDGSVVHMGTAMEARQVVVRIADHGPGVRDEELKSIFKPFFRGEGARGGESYGLGLAIARRAIDAHGGTIQASNQIGGGLLVEIRLPVDARGATATTLQGSSKT